MKAVIKEENDFSYLLLNVIYDEIIFENINLSTFNKSLPILESYGYKAIVFDNCESIHSFTDIFLSVLFEKVVFKNCLIDNSNSFLTARNQKTSNNSIKQIEFHNSIMVRENISISNIEKLTFINYEIKDRYYYVLLSNVIEDLMANFYGFGSSTSSNKKQIIINKAEFFSEDILYKILGIAHNASVYFEDGKELTREYVEKLVKARIRKEKINNLIHGN